jgi:hypothetical protein
MRWRGVIFNTCFDAIYRGFRIYCAPHMAAEIVVSLTPRRSAMLPQLGLV